MRNSLVYGLSLQVHHIMEHQLFSLLSAGAVAALAGRAGCGSQLLRRVKIGSDQRD